MKLQNKHTLFFILIFFLVTVSLVAFNYFLFIHKKVKAPSSIIDFDGDRMSDIAVYRASTGTWLIIPSSGGTPHSKGWGGNWADIPVTANVSSIY